MGGLTEEAPCWRLGPSVLLLLLRACRPLGCCGDGMLRVAMLGRVEVKDPAHLELDCEGGLSLFINGPGLCLNAAPRTPYLGLHSIRQIGNVQALRVPCRDVQI